MKKEQSMPNFVQMEYDVLSYWQEKKAFDLLKQQNANTGKYFSFLDGPITANNEMKLHHAWNRSLKDFMLKYKAMCGFDSCFQNGFDAQGLWVEVNVEKELNLNNKAEIENYGMDNFVEKCMERVKFFSSKITEQSKRLGQWMDWDNSYFTNSDTNISYIWHFLSICHQRGWLVQKYRPMPWCSHCGTSLSEHELADSYADLEHKAVFFNLPIKNTDMDMLVWTTTPWTLSANVAIAVNPTLTYAVCSVKNSERKIVVCKDAIKTLKDRFVCIDKEVLGQELVGQEYETCFEELKQQNFAHKIVAWEDVDATEGSGAVHIAPGCGAEDFELGTRIDLPIICPVDESGNFYEDFGFLAKMNTVDVQDVVFEELEKRNKLFYFHNYKHRYPICWRCKNPLIFRLSKEWYLKADEIRPQLLAAVEEVEWQPSFIKKRMQDWLNNMGDWNISRKRFYGLPLPFYKCEHCDHLTVAGSVEELDKLSKSTKASDLPHLHRPYIDDIEIFCPKCGHKVKRVTEVGDCWLDAGIAPFSTKKYFEDKEYFAKNFPAECVIEMKEQVRLWFYAILFMSVALENKAPYKKVIGFAALVAEDGSKFSKSGPNNLSFNELADKYSADVLRYIFASNNMQNDTRFGLSICEEARRKLLSLWNTYVFFNTYAVIDNPKLDGYKPKNLDSTDKWLITYTNEFIRNATNYYENQQFFNIVKEFEVYIDDVSNWYIRINRRRFWKSEEEEDKLNAYYSLFYALKNVSRVLAPITPYLSEYIHQNLVRELEPNSKESVILESFPVADATYEDKSLLEKTDLARQIINIAQRLRNENNLKIKQPLKTMFLSLEKEQFEKVECFKQIILDELNIKEMVYEQSQSKFNEKYLTLNFKAAGSVLKGDVQTVKNLLQNANAEQMQQYVEMFENGNVNIDKFENLPSNLFVLCLKAKQDFVIGTENSLTVVLDITLDEELMLEGLMRELVRAIQVLRKESNLNIEQRIGLFVETEDVSVNKVLEKYKNKIMQETLANAFENFEDATIARTVSIGGEEVVVKIRG